MFFATILFSSPLQILQRLKQVRFSLDNTPVYFDKNGDPPTGYDIICWIWRGTNWFLREVGSFNPDPISLTIDGDKIEWHKTGDPREVRIYGVILSGEKTTKILFLSLYKWKKI